MISFTLKRSKLEVFTMQFETITRLELILIAFCKGEFIIKEAISAFGLR